MADIGSSVYDKLNLGTSIPSAAPMETVEVEVSAAEVMKNFAKAFLTEAQRKAPLIYDRVGLTLQEVNEYLEFLVERRCECVADTCKDWRNLKLLWIPSFVQYNLRLTGEVVIRKMGLTITPVFPAGKEVITFDKALEISDKISAFDGVLALVQDAMPRDRAGDVDTMSTALIANRVCAMKEVNVVKTYVCAFMNFQLRKEATFKMLYRMQYDDLEYIARALCTQKVT